MDILRISKPTLTTKAIEFSPQYVDGKKEDVAGEKLGASSPYMEINTMAFWDENILKFSLDTSGFLPRFTATVIDVNKYLINQFMPIDDIASIYIRSDNVDYQSIRQDFRITSFYKVSEDVYFAEGILHVPNMFTEHIKSYKGTSFEVMKEIADSLGLGFASNVQSTNDDMYHLCHGMSPKNFIENEILDYIYLDDNSFFLCYVDQFYYLTLIEVNSLLKSEIEMDYTSFVPMGGEGHEEKDRFVHQLFLSNTAISDGKPNKIENFSISNVGGKRGMRDGYRQNIIYYDKDNRNSVQYFVEALTTEGIDADDRVVKGERNEDYTENTRNNVYDTLFRDNAHENYFFSKVFNKINKQEIGKIIANFDMNGVDFSLSNYMTVPILISNLSNLSEDLDADSDMTNVTMSGNYIITGMMYKFDQNSPYIRLSFVGRRREIRKKNLDETI